MNRHEATALVQSIKNYDDYDTWGPRCDGAGIYIVGIIHRPSGIRVSLTRPSEWDEIRAWFARREI